MSKIILMNKYGKNIYIAVINEIDNVFNIFHKHGNMYVVVKF